MVAELLKQFVMQALKYTKRDTRQRRFFFGVEVTQRGTWVLDVYMFSECKCMFNCSSTLFYLQN